MVKAEGEFGLRKKLQRKIMGIIHNKLAARASVFTPRIGFSISEGNK
jgi:hypothetical protein